MICRRTCVAAEYIRFCRITVKPVPNIGNFFRHFADSFQSPLRGLFFLFLLHLVTHPFRHIANAVPFLGFFTNVKKYMPKILYKNSVFQLTFTKSVAIIHMYI